TGPRPGGPAPAPPAAGVMMVGLAAAPPVEDLPARVPDRVQLAVLAEHLQVPVDGGQADVLAAAPQFRVDLLGAVEAGQAGQHGRERLGLPGAAYPGPPAPRGGGGSGHVRTVAAGRASPPGPPRR